MEIETLSRWLAEPRTELTNAVSRCVCDHVAALKHCGISFYGFALLPGEPYDISSLVAVHNCESDIKAPNNDDQYRYYKYSVDEWIHWEYQGFELVNKALVEANTQFASMHSKLEGDCSMDEFEIAHSKSLLEAILQGLEDAKASGVFGISDVFLAMWISDSGHGIIAESVRRLNSPAVAQEFMAEFG